MWKRIGCGAVGSVLVAMLVAMFSAVAEAQDLPTPPWVRGWQEDRYSQPGGYDFGERRGGSTSMIRPPSFDYTTATTNPAYTSRRGDDGYASCGVGCDYPGYASGDRGCYRFLENLQLFGTVDGFKGPLDLDGLNGNFGVRLAANAGFPVFAGWGLGGQAGAGVVISDFHGTQFTGSNARTQTFATLGLFQRNPSWAQRLSYGLAFDWLNDDYYTNFNFSQWRLKLGWELDECREIGIWASIPQRDDTAVLPNPPAVGGTSVNRFDAISQGVFYYRRYWDGGKQTSLWAGLAEEPGEFVMGADAKMPLTSALAIVGGF
ncbi:MAG: DUF6666 family protein, partial [Planctomycetota bacterium]